MEVKIHGRAASRPRVLAMQSPEDAKRPVTFWSFSGLFALSDFESNTRLSHETEQYECTCAHGYRMYMIGRQSVVAVLTGWSSRPFMLHSPI